VLVGQSSLTQIVVSICGNQLIHHEITLRRTKSSSCLTSLSIEDRGMNMCGAKRLDGADQALYLVAKQGDVVL
jgi:hypothetical protein